MNITIYKKMSGARFGDWLRADSMPECQLIFSKYSFQISEMMNELTFPRGEMNVAQSAYSVIFTYQKIPLPISVDGCVRVVRVKQ